MKSPVSEKILNTRVAAMVKAQMPALYMQAMLAYFSGNLLGLRAPAWVVTFLFAKTYIYCRLSGGERCRSDVLSSPGRC